MTEPVERADQNEVVFRMATGDIYTKGLCTNQLLEPTVLTYHIF